MMSNRFTNCHAYYFFHFSFQVRNSKHTSLLTGKKYTYSTNHVHLHRPNAFGFWQTHLHLCYETLKRISNFSELA